MRIVYSPDDGDDREFLFQPSKMFSFDSEAIEEVGGQVWANWDGFVAALDQLKGRALRAALWHELRKERPELMFAQVIVRPGQIRAFYDDEEIAAARELMEHPDTPDDVRAALRASLGKGVGGEPSATSDSDTDSPSPATD